MRDQAIGCDSLLHKASVLPLTVDGLLCRSRQPMASALYYIYCPPHHHLSTRWSCSLSSSCVCGTGKKDRVSRRRGASGEGGGDDSTQWDKTNKLVKVTGSFMRSVLVRRVLLFPSFPGQQGHHAGAACASVCDTYLHIWKGEEYWREIWNNKQTKTQTNKQTSFSAFHFPNLKSVLICCWKTDWIV